jgi:hypothetical protein
LGSIHRLKSLATVCRAGSAPLVVCALLAVASVGCARSGTVPDPKAAALSYAKAAEGGDGDAIYDMLSEGARKSRSRQEVKALVASERVELAEQAKALRAEGTRVEARAQLRYEDGETVALDMDRGRFWVSAAGALPGGARSPSQALDQLRRVLARRSYQGLMRVLTPSTRAAIESDLRSLVEGLENPDTLSVQTAGDSATVLVPGGHKVKLKRDAGIWRVEDFD